MVNKFKKKFFLNNKLLSLISLLLTLIFCEFLLRKLSIGFNASPIVFSSISHHEHPYNYKFLSYSPYGEWKDFIIRFDEFGNRILKKDCELKPIDKEYNLIFIGDSFVEGLGVEDANSFTGIIQKRFCNEGAKIYNLGVSSYSPVLSYLHLKHQVKFNPKVNLTDSSHIIHVLYDNDIDGDNTYSKLVKIRKEGDEVIRYVALHKEFSLIKKTLKKSYIYQLLRRTQLTAKAIINNQSRIVNINSKNFKVNDKCRLNQIDLMNTEKYIRRIKDFAVSYGTKYSLTAIPEKRASGRITNYACSKKIAQNLDLPFIESPGGLFNESEKYYFAKDLHLNNQGNNLFAEALINYLKQ